MIKKIIINNVQSHKLTELKFCKGINCIVGSSNNGKSAVLRALYWVKYNRPLGIDTLASHWIVDAKGNLKDEMSVSVENNGGTIIRKRTKDVNQYIVNDKELNVVKTDVPDEVNSLLSLSDTNIQKQLDAPFLLSLSSGDVAKYFNKIIKLDVIDKVLTNAEVKRRKTRQDIDSNNKLLNENKIKHESFSWLDNAGKLIQKCENVSSECNSIENNVNELKTDVNRYEEINSRHYDFTSQKSILEQIARLDESITKLRNEIFDLTSDTVRYDSIKIYDLSIPKKYITKIESINTDDSEIMELKNQINGCRAQRVRIRQCRVEIEDYKSQLPDVCPLCGNPMNECKDD